MVGVLSLTAQTPPPASPAQQPLTWKRDVPGDSTAIQLTADEAATWSDGTKRTFLLKGNVWIEQSGNSIRAPAVAIWVNEATKKTTGIYHLDLYAEGGTSLEIGAKTHQAPIGIFELNTRGEIKLKTFKTKVVQQALPDDPLNLRGLAARQSAVPAAPAPAVMPASAIKQVSATDAVVPPNPALPGLPPNMIKQASFQENAAPVVPPLVPTDKQPAVPAVPTVPAVPAQNPQVMQPPTIPVPGPPGTGASPVPIAPPPPGPVAPPAPPPKSAEAAPAPFKGEISIQPRTSEGFKIREFLVNGEKAVVFSPGIIVRVEYPQVPPKEVMITEVQADRAVLWSKSDVHEMVEGKRSGTDPNRGMEFYLSGNVTIRSFFNKTDKVIHCSEAYYDAARNVALALDADLEVREPKLAQHLHVQTRELQQWSEVLFKMPNGGSTNASQLPYGPGLELSTSEAQLEIKKVLKKSIFGVQVFNPKTGQPEYEEQQIFTGWNVIPYLEGIPIFYFPYLQGDVNDPLGPLENVSLGYSRTFGGQFFTTWNLFDLFGIDPPPGERWRLNLDYLTARGPQIGSVFNATGRELLGIPGTYSIDGGFTYIYDTGTDILGGNRGVEVLTSAGPPPVFVPIAHPNNRGRMDADLNWQDMPYGLSVQTRLHFVSDRNYYDQYFNHEWVTGPNQETSIYVKQQEDNHAIDLLVDGRWHRNWLTVTDSLPSVRGDWLGQDFLNLFSNNLKGGVGYFHLQPTDQVPLPFEPTDVDVQTLRFDVWDELSMPLQLGAFKVVPYGVLDFAYYSKGISGTDEARLYYGGGLRGSIPFSRLYPDIQSELLNLNGIYHKIVLSGDYYFAHSTVAHTQLPQLDRLNDDESDQALRDITPWQPILNPANAAMLTSGFFDPQLFALRKLVFDKVDTLDSIDEFTLDLRQRWQTKRGFPGQEHIVDWMTLDLSASFFPQTSQNFGETVNFLQYDWMWAIGDRTSLFSSGWFDPHPGGARAWDFGGEINRPDRTSLYLGYRQIDPLNSKAIVASVTIPFSSKYSLTGSTSYDFGVNSQINSLMLTRVGSDLVLSLGLTYNSILNNVGFAFEIYPTLMNRPPPGALALSR
jgi:hypothetical protein